MISLAAEHLFLSFKVKLFIGPEKIYNYELLEYLNQKKSPLDFYLFLLRLKMKDQQEVISLK